MVTSALPEGVVEQVRDDVANLVTKIGRGLHMTRAGVNLQLVDCSRPVAGVAEGLFEAKLVELRAALSDAQHGLVICNSGGQSSALGPCSFSYLSRTSAGTPSK